MSMTVPDGRAAPTEPARQERNAVRSGGIQCGFYGTQSRGLLLQNEPCPSIVVPQ
jgi:hypothetical protein